MMLLFYMFFICVCFVTYEEEIDIELDSKIQKIIKWSLIGVVMMPEVYGAIYIIGQNIIN